MLIRVKTGDELKYANQEWTVISWRSLIEPQFDKSGQRIDCQPMLRNNKNFKQVIQLSWLYWGEVEKIN